MPHPPLEAEGFDVERELLFKFRKVATADTIELGSTCLFLQMREKAIKDDNAHHIIDRFFSSQTDQARRNIVALELECVNFHIGDHLLAVRIHTLNCYAP